MRRLTEYQAIIVDMDGTLYYQKMVRQRMLKEMMMRPWRIRDFLIVKKYRELFEGGLDEQERYLVLPADAPAIINEWMIERPLPYLKMFRDKKLIDLLVRVMKLNAKVIVYSDYPVIEKLRALDFSPNLAYTSADTGCLKPNADGITRLLRQHAIIPERCLVIGDRNEKDGALANSMSADALILPASIEDRAVLYKNMKI